MNTGNNLSAAGSLKSLVNDATKLLPRKIARLRKVDSRTPQENAVLLALVEREAAFRLAKIGMQA